MSDAQPAAVEVSEARPTELAELGRTLVAAYRRVVPPVREAYVPMLADVAGRSADPDKLVLAARLGARPIGCATVVLADFEDGSGGSTEDAVQIRMLGVDPQFQGHGAGRALVAATVALARARDRGRIVLDTQAHMQAAQAIYLAAGFRRRPDRDRTVPGTDIRLLAHELVLGG